MGKRMGILTLTDQPLANDVIYARMLSDSLYALVNLCAYKVNVEYCH